MIDLLGQSLGVQENRSNGLGRLAGSWNLEELREFEQAVAPFERIDEELWRCSGYCLDTSAYSHVRRGNEKLVALIDLAEWIGLPTVTMGELRTGFLLGSRRERNESELREFLASPVVAVLEVDAETSRHYAEIVADHRGADTPLPTNDVWIAATAARHGAAVLTCDDHFERIARVGAVLFDPS